MPSERGHVCLGGKVPKLNRPVLTARGEQPAVGRNRDTQHRLFVPMESMRFITPAKVLEVIPFESAQILTSRLRTMPFKQGGRAQKISGLQRLLCHTHVCRVKQL